MLTAEEWNERYPNGTPVLCVAVCGPRPTVGYAPSLAARQDEIGVTRIRTWTHGAFWRDDHVDQIEPLATDAERLAAGWLDPEAAAVAAQLIDALRAWQQLFRDRRAGRAGEGWYDREADAGERAFAVLDTLDAARAWRASRSPVEKHDMDDDEIRLEDVVTALDAPDTETPPC